MRHFGKNWGKASRLMTRVILATVTMVALLATSIPVLGAMGENDVNSISPINEGPLATAQGAVSVAAVESDVSGTTIDIQVPDIQEAEITVNGDTFQLLSIPDYGYIADVGKPQIPVIRETVAIPDGASVTATVADSSYSTYTGYRVYPVQQPETDSEGESEFVIDEEFYSQDEFYPEEIVEVRTPGIWRDIAVVGVQVNPVQFNPATGELRVYDHITVQLEYSGGIYAAKTVEPDYGQMYESTILNYGYLNIEEKYLDSEDMPVAKGELIVPEGAGTDGADLDGTPIETDVKLISIRPYAGIPYADIKPLLDWHKKRGLPSQSWWILESAMSADMVKSVISSVYDSHPELEYVILVGDIDLVSWQSNWNGYPGDYWYACLTGGATPDLYPEVAVGRLSVTEGSQLDDQIDKIIDYSDSPYYPYDWLYNALLIAHKQEAPYKYQGCKESIRTATYSDPFTFDTCYGAAAAQGGDDATNADVIAAIEEGRNIVNYRGHGGTNCWCNDWNTSNEEFWTTQADGLNNGDMTPVVFSIACKNLYLDSASETLGEAFVKDDQSAVAFLGAARPSYTTPNHDFDRFLFDAIGNEHIYNIGKVLNDANTELIDKWIGNPTYSYFVDNCRMYLWLGDPALELWSGMPKPLSVSYPSTVDNEIKVTVKYATFSVVNALVCLTKGDPNDPDVYTYGYTDTNGEVTFSFSADSDGPMNVWVTKHNYIPHRGTTNVDTTAPTVTVTAPNGGEVWNVGEVHDITWTATDTVDSINIYYSLNGGLSYPYIIATGEANDGTYAWTIPNKPTSTCRVKVAAVDEGGLVGSDTSDANFTIGAPDIWVQPESQSFEVTLPPDAIWSGKLTLGNAGSQVLDYDIVDTETTPGPYFRWSTQDPDPLPAYTYGKQEAMVGDPDGLGDIDYVKVWVYLNPNDWTYMRDDGVAPDETAGDGIYTCTVYGATQYGTEWLSMMEAKDMAGNYGHLTIPIEVDISDAATGDGQQNAYGSEADEVVTNPNQASESNGQQVENRAIESGTGDVPPERIPEPETSTDADGVECLVLGNYYYAECAADLQANIPDVTFDSWDATTTPSLSLLQQYDVVLLFEDGYFSNAPNVGDAVYNYVMGGGNVVIGTFYWQDRSDNTKYIPHGWGNLETIDPFTSDTQGCEYDYDEMDPTTVVAHPITSGVNTLWANSYRGGVSVTAKPQTVVLAYWATTNYLGEPDPLVGYNMLAAGQRLVAISIIPHYGLFPNDFGGDYYTLWENALKWAGEGMPDCTWLDESPESGSVATYSSQEVAVDIDTSGMATGEYSAEMYIRSNDIGESPTIVPVQLTVKPAIEAGNVLFDESHSPTWNFYIDQAYQDWADLLETWGFTVDKYSQGEITYELLSQYCAVIISNPTVDYTDAEVDAITDYVNDGGGLLVLGEFSNYGGTLPIVNELAAPFDMSFNNDVVYDSVHNEAGTYYWPLIPDFDASVAGADVDTVVEYAGCSVNAEGTAFPIAWAYGGATTDMDAMDVLLDVAGLETGEPAPVPVRRQAVQTEAPESPDGTAGEEAVSESAAAPLSPIKDTDAGGKVLWDLTHGVYPGYEPDEYYSGLVEVLTEKGYTIETTTSGVESVNLEDYAVLVVCLASAWDSAYTGSEVAAIAEFVENGGGLLVMGDHPGCPNDNINLVAGEFGTTCGVADSNETISDMAVHPIFDGVSQFYLGGAAGEIESVAPSQEVAWDDMERAVVSVTSGAGKAVFTGDVDMWTDNYLATDDNQLFAENVFDWLSTPPERPVVMAASLHGSGRAVVIGDGDVFDNWDWDGDGIMSLYEYDNEKLAVNIIDWLCQPEAPAKPDLVVVSKEEVKKMPQKYLHSYKPIFDPTEQITRPLTSVWHELYPTYCNYYEILNWKDNGDDVLSPCDWIVLQDTETGEEEAYHVDRMTITIFVEGREMAFECLVPYENVPNAMKNPMGPFWHQVYPTFCIDYAMIAWKDLDLNDILSAGDLVRLQGVAPDGEIIDTTVNEVSWDIIVSPELAAGARTYMVTYTIRNQGTATAPRGHSATLYVDKNVVEHQVIAPALAPGDTFTIAFRTIVECTDSQDIIVVNADDYDQVDESNENNNWISNTWQCCEPSVEVIKKVWDRLKREWVEEVCAQLEETVRFQCTIHNDGECCNLTNILVTDVLSESLRYAGKATVNGKEWEPEEIGPNQYQWNFKDWILEPCQSIVIEFNAMVVKWSQKPDINVQMAKAYCRDFGVWVEDRDTAAVQPYICGDVNMDAKVNMADVMILWYDIAEYPYEGAWTISNECAADVNCDGKINMADVMILWYDIAEYPSAGAWVVKCCSHSVA